VLVFYSGLNIDGIKKIFAEDNYSLQYFLRQKQACRFTNLQPAEIKNINTIEEMEAAHPQFTK
jgi:molybdopterin-guanine dinucleotide biosynthesis protein A